MTDGQYFLTVMFITLIVGSLLIAALCSGHSENEGYYEDES